MTIVDKDYKYTLHAELCSGYIYINICIAINEARS